MKFKLHYTHNFWKYKDVEIYTLEELLKLVKKEDCWIIVEYRNKKDWDKEVAWQYVLEVYDSYRE